MKYTHAVARRILNEHGKETDELIYCVDVNHAHSTAMQGLAAGWVGVAIVELKDHEQVHEVANTG